MTWCHAAEYKDFGRVDLGQLTIEVRCGRTLELSSSPQSFGLLHRLLSEKEARSLKEVTDHETDAYDYQTP